MGTLTSDMTRLCADIVSLRVARGTLMKHMAREAKDLEKSVSSMCAGFTRARKVMARKSSAERAAFMSGLHKTVSQNKKEVLDDLAGARHAWCGTLAVTAAKHHVHTPAVAETKPGWETFKRAFTQHTPAVAETKHEAKTRPVFPDASRGKDMHIKDGSKKKKHHH